MQDHNLTDTIKDRLERKYILLKNAGLSDAEIERKFAYDQEVIQAAMKAIAEGSPYADLPKTNPSGSGRLNPFRSAGESESRIPPPARELLVSNYQDPTILNVLAKSVFGNNSDIDGAWLNLEQMTSTYQDVTDLESRSASKSTWFAQQPLEITEYNNRKLEIEKLKKQLKIRQEYLETLTGARLPRFMVPDTSEFLYDPNLQYKGLLLPYRRCLFILNPGPEIQLVYAEQLDTSKVLFTVKTPTQATEDNQLIGQFTFWWDGELHEDCWFVNASAEDASQQARVILTILDGLSKGYAVAEGEAPPTDRKIPEARKGCTVRVVKLHPNAEKIRKAWQGGTHASPREHTRRAHWRRNHRGEWKRIGEQVINKGIGDVVGKEYLVKKCKPKSDDFNK